MADAQVGWASSAVIGVLLAFVFPVLFARPHLGSFSSLPVVLSSIVTLYAATRLWLLVTRGSESLISLTFWLFIYVWMGLGALANTVSQQFPLFNQHFSEGTEVGALITIIVGLAGYELGRMRSRSRTAATRAAALLNAPTVKMRRVAILGGLGALVVVYYTLKFGLGTRFTSREASAQAFFGTPTTNVPLWLQNNKTSALIQISVDWVLVFLALYLMIYDRRIRRAQGTYGALSLGRRLLVFAVIGGVFLADNPFSNPRYRFGGVAVALILAFFPLTGRRFRLLAGGLVIAALFVYPYAALFRYNKRSLNTAPLAQQFRTDADFSMFQQELNAQVYVQQHGLRLGRQFEGVVFAWVPRRFWASKPGFTGSMVLGQYATVLPASLSIFGWSYVDGGIPWVFVMLTFYGFVSGALEQAYLRRPRDRLTFAAAAVPIFAAFQVFLVRGDLQPAVGELAPVFVALASVCVFRNSLRRQRFGVALKHFGRSAAVTDPLQDAGQGSPHLARGGRPGAQPGLGGSEVAKARVLPRVEAVRMLGGKRPDELGPENDGVSRPSAMGQRPQIVETRVNRGEASVGGNRPSEIVRRYFAALTAHDLDAATGYWQPGAIDRIVGQQDLVAPHAIREYYRMLFAAFPDFTLELLDVTTARDRTAVRWRAHGTFAGPGFFQGFAPNGRQMRIEGCDMLRVKGDRITHNDVYLNGISIAQQLGFLPSVASPAQERLAKLANLRTWLRAGMHGLPPKRIADGVWIVRGGFPLRVMNVYLIEDEGGVTVFDAGISAMTGAVAVAAARLGGANRVVLGHADADHRGVAAGLGAPVFCHADEREAAESASPLRPYWDFDKLSPLPRFLFERLLPVWDGGAVPVAGTLSEGDPVAGFRVIELPGHAPGLIGLLRESDRLALVSDCFYTLNPQTGIKGGPRTPHPAFNADTLQARRSITKLAELEPSMAWAGHADPVTGDVRAQLERAASEHPEHL